MVESFNLNETTIDCKKIGDNTRGEGEQKQRRAGASTAQRRQTSKVAKSELNINNISIRYVKIHIELKKYLDIS